jgi:drug/metabolite transporter (DMT)-like permease
MLPIAYLGPVAAVVTVLIWTSFIVIARASASLDLLPLDIAWLRIVGASAVLLPWSLWQVAHRAQGRVGSSLGGCSPLPWRMTVLVGVFGGLLYAMLAYSGFFFAPAAHAAVLMPGSLPLWTTLLAMLFLAERPGVSRLLGLAFILGGGLLVGGASLLDAFKGSDVWKGDLLFMGAALCWSAYSVLVRRHALDPVQTTMAITAFAFFAYVPLYGVAAWLQWIPSRLLVAPAGQWVFQAVFQGMGSVVVSGISFTLMIRHFGPVRSTMITALVPGLSALGAVAVLGEPMHWNLLLGLTLVTVGIFFGVRGVPARIAD